MTTIKVLININIILIHIKGGTTECEVMGYLHFFYELIYIAEYSRYFPARSACVLIFNYCSNSYLLFVWYTNLYFAGTATLHYIKKADAFI